MYAALNQLLASYGYDCFPLTIQQGYKETSNHVVYQADNIERDLFKGGSSKTKLITMSFDIYARNIVIAETMATELEDIITTARGYIDSIYFVCAFQTTEIHEYNQESRMNVIHQTYTMKLRFSKYLSSDSDIITADSNIITADGGTI